MKPRRVELHVGELVLVGVPEAQRYVVAEAFRQELTQLFSQRGLAASLACGGDIESLEIAEFIPPRDATPALVAVRAARAAFQALGHEVSSRGAPDASRGGRRSKDGSRGR